MGESAKIINKKSNFDIRHLEAEKFIKERLNPSFGEEAYLHLSDLYLALEPVLSSCCGHLLDFGCGGSPYRGIFKGTTYHRADVGSDLEGIDFQIGIDCQTGAPSGFYDSVLSTQVLEHVPDEKLYLQEAYRVLKPGGKLLISTHGAFFDHGCPYDFHRWTVDGLALEMRSSGFIIEKMQKLTLGARAVFFLAENQFGGLWGSRATLRGWGLWFFQRFFWMNRAKRHQWVDQNFPHLRVADALNSEPLYICIFAVGVKPKNESRTDQ
jgi:SAM-dependent methyltransferase